LSPPTPHRRRRWKTWLLALLIFLAGTLFGGALTAGAIFRSVHRAIAHPEEAPQRITARLSHRLDLTDDQRERVRQIIASRQQSLLDIRRDVQPRIETQLEQLESEIAAVLNPKQQEQWRTMVSTFRKTWLPPVAAPTTRINRMNEMNADHARYSEASG
jgi:hypothetical protein